VPDSESHRLIKCAAAVAVEPGKRAFDHPAAGQDLEALRAGMNTAINAPFASVVSLA